MAVTINRSGILDTVQDLGRYGYRALGINPGGVMDRSAVRIINVLLGNEENSAVLEMHFPAAILIFETETLFAVGGADLGAELDGSPVPNWRVTKAPTGAELRFRKKSLGNRTYLAIRGGFEIKPWLGSASTNLFANAGGFHGRALRAGDVVNSGASDAPVGSYPAAGPGIIPGYRSSPTLRVTAAPESDLLTAQSANALFTSEFNIGSGSNRMGFRLEGPRLKLLAETELVSSAVNFGTVQLLPDGNPVVLMADAQTAGGYPRIANVIAADLPVAAQLGPGDTVRFTEISPEEAVAASRRFERDLCFLRMGIKLGRH